MAIPSLSEATRLIIANGYVYAAGGYNQIYRTQYGNDVDWETISISPPNSGGNTAGIAYGNGRLVVAFRSATAWSDDDGDTWDYGCANLPAGVEDIQWDPVVGFVAVTNSSLFVSSDGETWTAQRDDIIISPARVSNPYNTRLFVDGEWAYFAYPTNICETFGEIYHVARINATAIEPLGTSEYRPMWRFDGYYFAVSNSATTLYRSADLQTWDAVLTSAVGLRDLIKANDQLHLIGSINYPQQGRIAVSTDGGASFGSWINTTLTDNGTHYIYTFVYHAGSGAYIGLPANGYSGPSLLNQIYRSTDLATWTPVTSSAGYVDGLGCLADGSICTFNSTFTRVHITTDGGSSGNNYLLTGPLNTFTNVTNLNSSPTGELVVVWQDWGANGIRRNARSTNGIDWTEGQSIGNGVEILSADRYTGFLDTGHFIVGYVPATDNGNPTSYGLIFSEDDGATYLPTGDANYIFDNYNSDSFAPGRLLIDENTGVWYATMRTQDQETFLYTSWFWISEDKGQTWSVVETMEMSDDASTSPGFVMCRADPSVGGIVVMSPTGRIYLFDGATPSPEFFSIPMPGVTYVSARIQWMQTQEYAVFTETNRVYTSPDLVAWTPHTVYSTDGGSNWNKGSADVNPNDLAGPEVILFGDGVPVPNDFASGRIVSMAAAGSGMAWSYLLVQTQGW